MTESQLSSTVLSEGPGTAYHSCTAGFGGEEDGGVLDGVGSLFGLGLNGFFTNIQDFFFKVNNMSLDMLGYELGYAWYLDICQAVEASSFTCSSTAAA